MSLSFADVVAHTEFTAQTYQTSEDKIILGITLKPDDHWHTYWSNPGDAGLTLSIRLSDENLTVSTEEFPTPQRYELGGIVAYGYEQPKTFLFTISGELPDVLEGKATWLTCDDSSCLPGSKKFSIPLAPESSEEPDWLVKARSEQPSVLETQEEKTTSDDRQWTFSFQHDAENLSGWSVYPKSESFSESNGKTSLDKAGKNYVFTMTCSGNDTPETIQFLITDGKQGHLISFYQ